MKSIELPRNFGTVHYRVRAAARALVPSMSTKKHLAPPPPPPVPPTPSPRTLNGSEQCSEGLGTFRTLFVRNSVPAGTVFRANLGTRDVKEKYTNVYTTCKSKLGRPKNWAKGRTVFVFLLIFWMWGSVSQNGGN